MEGQVGQICWLHGSPPISSAPALQQCGVAAVTEAPSSDRHVKGAMETFGEPQHQRLAGRAQGSWWKHTWFLWGWSSPRRSAFRGRSLLP